MPCILLYVDPVVLDTPRVTYRRGSGGATCPAGTDTGLPLEDSPTHRIQCGVVEACSAAAARRTAFVRPHCRLRFTEVHSAAACAASAQSPSATLNRYDGTALFHHAAYATSYTARSATLQATSQATPWRRFDKTGRGYAGQRNPADRQGNPGMRSPSPATP